MGVETGISGAQKTGGPNQRTAGCFVGLWGLG